MDDDSTRRELKNKLTAEQYEVTQNKATERAFSGEYWNAWSDGTYHCVVCDQPLFSSENKFDAHCGWPSFDAPLDGSNIEEVSDRTLWMRRTESVCGNCGAHLGHVFNDGPTSTGLRYCMNSASLNLKESN